MVERYSQYSLDYMHDTKTLVSSWTFWFGLAQIALGGIGYLSALMEPMEAIALMTTGLGAIGLRLKTDKPIGSVM